MYENPKQEEDPLHLYSKQVGYQSESNSSISVTMNWST